MDLSGIVFIILAAVTVLSAIAVVLFKNPIYSALSLALSMTGVAALFFSLGAYFVAGVQLIVYAGAVMVMFVMVVMLIDLKHQGPTFSRGAISTFFKVLSTFLVLGTMVATFAYSYNSSKPTSGLLREGLEPTRALAKELFTKYVFGFEVIGVVLLVVLIGAIALSRARGGTHHA